MCKTEKNSVLAPPLSEELRLARLLSEVSGVAPNPCFAGGNIGHKLRYLTHI